jgi:hypothetical protein
MLVFDVSSEGGADADDIVVVPGETAGLPVKEFVLGGSVTPEVVVIAMGMLGLMALHRLDAGLSAPSELPVSFGPKLIPPPSNVGSEVVPELVEHRGGFATAAE